MRKSNPRGKRPKIRSTMRLNSIVAQHGHTARSFVHVLSLSFLYSVGDLFLLFFSHFLYFFNLCILFIICTLKFLLMIFYHVYSYRLLNFYRARYRVYLNRVRCRTHQSTFHDKKTRGIISRNKRWRRAIIMWDARDLFARDREWYNTWNVITKPRASFIRIWNIRLYQEK